MVEGGGANAAVCGGKLAQPLLAADGALVDPLVVRGSLCVQPSRLLDKDAQQCHALGDTKVSRPVDVTLVALVNERAQLPQQCPAENVARAAVSVRDASLGVLPL
eukprot:scaffold132689_cov57-Phaeocystis_antarctica.AAC.1